MNVLTISNLKVSIGDKPILNGLNLEIPQGEVHIIMGPNGVGKSTLGHVLMGSSQYKKTEGTILLCGEDLCDLETDERARRGLFLGFQYPVAVPGLRLSEYLRNLYNLHHENASVSEFRRTLKRKMELLSIDASVLNRFLNEGFSGGEMKRLEMLQLALVTPKIALLDEIDSGVDLDAQKTIAQAIRHLAQEDGTAFVIVTHYQRLLNFIEPDRVHILLDGRIEHSGDLSLVASLEREGYDWVRQQDQSAVAAQP